MFRIARSIRITVDVLISGVPSGRVSTLCTLGLCVYKVLLMCTSLGTLGVFVNFHSWEGESWDLSVSFLVVIKLVTQLEALIYF